MDHSFNWQPMVKRRLAVVAAVFVCWTMAVEARLVFLQVISHADLVERAERQQLRTTTVPAKRGEIVDRRGRLLAYSVDADTVYAVPYEVTAPGPTAAALCKELEHCTAKERAAIAERLSAERPFVYVRRRITPSEAGRIAALKLPGVGFMKESRRFYPNRDLGAHLLGYVGLDNVGLSGLEAAYDKTIRGNEGKFIANTDARRQSFGGRLERAPTAGGSLELTIDEQLQHIVERELRAGVEEKRADGGSAVVIDPQSGEILALASYPTFNPNSYSAASELARRNRAVQDIYEPGSTFKVVTVAAALQERLMPVTTMIATSPGIIRLGGRVIDEFEGHDYGTLSLTDVIVKSSNVGAVKIGLKLGAERFGLYATRFGFGKPTSPDFPSESPGILWPAARLNDSGIASMSMGYQVSVTPLQMAAAMSAVANGGTWIEPRVVRAVTQDGVRRLVTPRTTRQVISEATAAEMLPILEAVVTEGTGKRAQVPGYTVAGKTGTADKIVNGRYVGSMQNVSFLGFVPARRPALTVIVMIDTPRVGSDTGGVVAAPIFQRIAQSALRYLGVAPDAAPVSPIVVARNGAAQSSQPQPQPLPVTALLPAVLPITFTSGEYGEAAVPDVRGMGAREALRTLTRRGLAARLQGTGVVVEQTPAPGSAVPAGTTCTLTLQREPLRQPSGAGAGQP